MLEGTKLSPHMLIVRFIELIWTGEEQTSDSKQPYGDLSFERNKPD